MALRIFLVDCHGRNAKVPVRENMKERYLRLVRGSYRMLRHKRLRRRPWWRAMTKPLFDRHLWIPCRDTVASGLAIGMFFSMILVLPLQMLFSAVLAMRFRVNVPFAMAACWVSNVFTNVPLGLGQYKLGEWMRSSLGFPMPAFPVNTRSWSSSLSIPQVLREVIRELPEDLNLGSFFLGMMISAVILALLAFPIVHLFSAVMPHHLPVLKRRQAKISQGEGI